MDRTALEDEFVAKLRAAWARGAEEYGDESFGKPICCTQEEILQEIVDIAGWSFIAFVQTRNNLDRARRSAVELGLPRGSAHDLAKEILARVDSLESPAIDYPAMSMQLVRDVVRHALDAVVSTSAAPPATSPPPR